jgi:PAS domain S-box-containing protein
MVFQLLQRPDGRRCFPFVSEGVRVVCRLSPAAVAANAKALWTIVHRDDARRVAESIDASARELARWQCEFRVRFGRDEVRWLGGTAMPERQEDGTIVWHGFVSDITERKLADRAHEESRALLQSVFASVDLGVFVVDVAAGGDFRFMAINPAYERLIGIPATEVRGRVPRQLVPLIPAEMAECLRVNFKRGAEAPRPIEYEEPFFVRGRLLWLHTRLTPVRDASGNVVRLVGRSLDITERKAVELRFQSLTERLQLATEAAQIGIWDYDLVQGRMVWDKRMHALYGLGALEFGGTFAAWRERIHPADAARVEREVREAIELRKPLSSSFRIAWPAGELREIRACAHVQRNPAGRAVRMVGVNWDVTAERRSQAEMIKARDEAQKLNLQLGQALERANQLACEAAAATVAKSEFLANMSHEIRTPMNAVIGMSGLLLGTELTAEQREFAETIRSSGDALLGLINDILDYSKIESGRLELEKNAFILRECVESAVDVLASRAAEKRIDLIASVDHDVPAQVIGDVTRLRQVLVNLLSNAVKFTARGQVFLCVATQPGRAGLARLRFAVHDSGIGIPADRMDRLFKTFSQVDASTTRQFGGTGLGLAISRRLVELMGGRIWVESAEGQGSVFYFEVEMGSVEGTSLDSDAARMGLLAGRRVLIVDDNATCCRVLCQQCVAWGMMPRAVSSGIEALAVLAQDEGFDVALVDREMPGMSGVELAGEIRRARRTMGLPIAFLTWPGQVREPVELTAAGTLHKPIKTRALLELLLSIVQGPSNRTSVAAAVHAPLAVTHPLEILLAEDNPVNQRVATLMLQRLGYRVDVAGNGREALAAIDRKSYDLVLMDVQMPEMDGLQATRELCARARERRPRIVAMTANASTADREQCFAAGMDDFLSKPVRAADLQKALLATPRRGIASAA